ncbi:MAG: hypothetical protein PHS02_02470 [Candidatus ainarchaeum sp.]|nr:hypothetical protein [Candidatus ainarchaeum sp.]
MHSRKGQVAIEYLMNYGWAILVLAIVIAAIMLTGVFNPTYYVMEECYLGTSFRCAAQMVSQPTDAQLALNITNTMSYPVRIKNVTFTPDDSGVLGTTAPWSPDAQLNSSDSIAKLDIQLTGNFQKGSAKKLDVQVNYYICAEEVNPRCETGSEFLRTVSGRIVAQPS